MSEIASAFVTIAPSARGFGSSLNKQVGPAAASAGKSAGAGLGKAMLKGFIAIGVLTKATQFLGDSLGEAREAAKVSAQTGAVLRSTGGIANVSAKQIGNLATALSNKIGVDDEAIQAGENLLLTFTNVRNEAGKGNDIFTQATGTVQDMAAAFGGDAVSNSKILGKALNDPIKGVSALTRVGVSFTEGQKDQIKAMVESGDIMGAQKIILGELAKEAGGSAEAQVTNADKARVAYGNLKEQVGTALIPVMDRFAGTVTKDIIPAISGFISGMEDGTGAGGQFRDAIEDLVGAVKGILGFLNGLPGPVKQFGAEIAIAALILPRLTAALGVTKLQGFITAISTAETRTKALTSAAKTAAGAGGLGLLIDASRRGDSSLGLLESAAGGAALGFSMGGPWGALIGGVGGGLIPALKELASGSDDVAGSMKAAKPIVRDFASTLDTVTAASTAATGALALQALQERGSLEQGIALGLSQRTLVNATLGRKGALDTVRAAIDQYTNAEVLATSASEAAVGAAGGFRPVYGEASKATQKQAAAAEGLANSLGVLTPQLKDQTRKTREQIAATTDYSGKLKGLPKEVVTAIRQNGIEPSVRAIADLTKRYDLTRKDVKTLITATGVDTTVRQVQKVLDRLALVKDKTVTVTVKTNRIGGGSVTSSSGGHSAPETPRTAEKYGKQIGDGLARGIASSTEKVGSATDKLGKKIKEKLAKIRDSLASVRSDFASLVEPIATNFTQGLFDFDTAGAFTANLTTVKGTLTTLLDNFKKLIGEGLNPGFLYQLFQSGGPGLINSLAGLSAAEAQSAGALFGQVTSLSTELGTAVAGATDKGDRLENQTVRLEKKLDHLIKAVHNSADRTGDVVNGAAGRGHRRGHG